MEKRLNGAWHERFHCFQGHLLTPEWCCNAVAQLQSYNSTNYQCTNAKRMLYNHISELSIPKTPKETSSFTLQSFQEQPAKDSLRLLRVPSYWSYYLAGVRLYTESYLIAAANNGCKQHNRKKVWKRGGRQILLMNASAACLGFSDASAAWVGYRV